MIQAKDLKIGNWVQNDAGYKWQIEDGWQIDEATDKEMYQPIPLTPEILLKCGFIKQWGDNLLKVDYKSESYDKWDDLTLTKLTKGGFQNAKGEYYYYLGGRPTTTVLYLHQLQNLYHSLTGEELKINL